MSKYAVAYQLQVPSGGVTLTEGRFRKAFDNNIAYLKKFDLDRMLYWYRVHAGKPAPGAPYAAGHGHFENNLHGETVGTFLMGAGTTLLWREDEELRGKVQAILDEIKEYQERLKKLGYLTTTPDGNYGKDTVAAVERFQEINGLIPDGFLGYNTIKKLKSSSAKANALQLGMEGDDVENVQKLLKKLGYMNNVTGYFGSQTEDAVKAFQKRNGLSQDGTVGRNTMNVLTSSSAKKASSSSSSVSSSSSSGSSSSPSSSSNKSGIEKFIDVAESKLGCKYVFSAKGPNQFDCSGFVYYCLNQAGVSQGYMTSSGWANSSKYPKVRSMSKIERGDILVFDGHVAIYLGNGKMIDASSSKGKVVTRSGITSSSYWTSHFICAFRVF